MIRLAAYRNPSTQVYALMGVALLLWLLVGMVQPVFAEGILDVNAATTHVDLGKYRSPIAAERAKIGIQGPGDQALMNLNARGKGPTYFWSLFSFRNTSTRPIEFVLTVPSGRFVGSGLFKITNINSPVLGAIATSGQELSAADTPDMRGFAFRVAPQQIFNMAVESETSELNAELWQRQDLADSQSSQYFGRGLLMGTACLIAFAMLALFAARLDRVFLAGWLFATAAVIFVAFEAGFLPELKHIFPETNIDTNITRGLLESTLALALGLCVPSFTGLRRIFPVLAYVLFVPVLLMLANLVLVFQDPLRATSFARFGFVAAVSLGFLITSIARLRTRNIVDPGLLFWTLILGWTVLAGIVSQSSAPDYRYSLAIMAGLDLVLVSLAFVLLRFMARIDAARKALAVAQPSAIQEDWHEDEVEVPQFERRAQPTGLHRPTPRKSVAALAPGQLHERDVRSRNADEVYRWHASNQPAVVPADDFAPSTPEQALERRSHYAGLDSVTGLPSRAMFIDRLEREMAKPRGPALRLMVIDLDRFKTLNDALGHEQGDMLLQIVANRLSDCIAPDETVARISGAQFSVMQVETNMRQKVTTLADEIAKALAVPIALPRQELALTASFGISGLSTKAADVGVLLQQANTALLEARHRGGGMAVIFDDKMRDDRAAMLGLESDLRRAINRDEIEVHFQPIANLGTMEIAGYEALARWRHPLQGLVPPSQFIEMAEKAGMIGEVGRIVLGNAARQLGVWQRVLGVGRMFFVSVNISPSHLLEDDFVGQIQNIMERESLAPGRLKLEITESVIMHQPNRVADLFRQLRRLGVGLACDDFGTGFSNLASLRDLPFDTLKLDRSFIAAEDFGDRSRTIITTITDLANRLGMVVVAEGIERQLQVEQLLALGCDLGQGYLIGLPLSAAEVSDQMSIMPRHIASVNSNPVALKIQPDDEKSLPPRTLKEIWPERKSAVVRLQNLANEIKNATPTPGMAPLAPRVQKGEIQTPVELEKIKEPQELPSIFSVTTVTDPEPKAAPSLYQVRPKPPKPTNKKTATKAKKSKPGPKAKSPKA